MLATLPRPIVIAHRGASSRAPENTMAAFERALRDGAEGIELDAKLSRDGKVLIFHDATLSRTTDGHGKVSEKTAAELRELDAGSHFGPEFLGEKIPFLDEVLDTFAGKLLINIEFKGFRAQTAGLVDRVCDLVLRHGAQGSVLFSAFHPASLSRAARLLPEVPRGLLAAAGWLGAWARSFGFSFGDYSALHSHISDCSAQQVKRVHRLGRRLHVWVVNEPAVIGRLGNMGVDGIFTTDPAAALRVLGRAS